MSGSIEVEGALCVSNGALVEKVEVEEDNIEDGG